MNGSSISDLLSNPGIAAVLSAYGSLLTTPRVQGRGAALGRALLGGVEGWQGAQEQQARAPLLAAQTEEARAHAPYLAAETKYLGTETDVLAKDYARRQEAANQVDKLNLDPLHKFVLKQGILGYDVKPEAAGLATPYQQGEMDLRRQALDAQKQHYQAEQSHWRSLEEKGAGTVTDAEAFRAFTSARSRWDTGIAALDPSMPLPTYLSSFENYKRAMGVGGTAAPSSASAAPSAPSRPGARKAEAPLSAGAVGKTTLRAGSYTKNGRKYRVDGSGNVYDVGPAAGGAGR